MKYLALLLLVACGGNDPAAPPNLPEPPSLHEYRLESLVYEDVYPAGGYAGKLVRFSGSATMGFGETDGKLIAPSAVSGVMHYVLADSSEVDEGIVILPQGVWGFSFTMDSGVVKFGKAPPLWPFPQGASLSDSLYSFSETQCFNPDCTDYVKLAFRFVR
jgi:hypothetical protein